MMRPSIVIQTDAPESVEVCRFIAELSAAGFHCEVRPPAPPRRPRCTVALSAAGSAELRDSVMWHVRAAVAASGLGVEPTHYVADAGVMEDDVVYVDVAPGSQSAATVAPLIERFDERLRVASHVLPLRPAARAELPPGFCLDQATARTVAFVAGCLASSEPCLLEGDTASSKSSAAACLAALTGLPLHRVELSRDSDTAHVVGRYQPSTNDNGAVRWEFVDGPLVSAMKHGGLLVLEELNLAEPAVVERLNGVLESPPSLSVTEGGAVRALGGYGDAVSEDFRIVATMNPGDFQGRSAQSRAFLDRWTRWVAPVPGVAEFRAMLRLQAFGEQPDVVVDGVRYAGTHGVAVHPGLARLGPTLEVLADLHAALAALVDSGELGSDRAEPYVFTRRALLRMARWTDACLARGMECEQALARGLGRTYLAQLATRADRQRVLNEIRFRLGVPIATRAEEMAGAP